MPQDKQTLRQNAFRKRMTLPAAVQKQAVEQMTSRFLENVPLAVGDIVAGYCPVNAEINVMPLLTQLLKKGIICALPRVMGKDKPLSFYQWQEKTPLKPNTYGVKEPDPVASSLVTPGIVIVPLLAFDNDGYRLGYGAGFYDRTLVSFKGLAVGVAFDIQRVDKLPREGHDCKLDMVITERKIYTPTGDKA